MLKKNNHVFNFPTTLLILIALFGCSNINASPLDDNSSFKGVSFKRVYPNLSFENTIFMLQTPIYKNRWYVIEKTGQLYWFDGSDDQANKKNLILDLPEVGIELSRCNECGLLGMEFDPEYGDNGFVYLSYTVPEKNSQTRERMRSLIVRFTLIDDGKSIDLTSKKEIFSQLQPYGNHNGGHITFGSDGYLYTSFGDGGSGNDPLNHGQNKTTLLGSLLRITKEGKPAPGNLLAKQGGAKEIYAWGLRNPWRWSFDRQTQELWVADVGQRAQEEVNIVVNGGNYGWRCEEGLRETKNKCTTSGPYMEPVTTYGRDEGTSITGGYVYRGTDYRSLQGVYFFGDFTSGRIWSLHKEQDKYVRTLIQDTDLNISSFAEGLNGDVYALNYFGGIYKLSRD